MALHGYAGALSLAGLALATPSWSTSRPAGSGQWEAELAALRGRCGRRGAHAQGRAAAVERSARRHGQRRHRPLRRAGESAGPDQHGTPAPDHLVHQRLLDEHPDLVVRFLAVLFEAAEWAADHPAELDSILAAERLAQARRG